MREPSSDIQINFNQDQSLVTTKLAPPLDTAISIPDSGQGITHRKIIRVSCCFSVMHLSQRPG